MPEASTGAPHRATIGRTAADDPARAEHVEIICTGDRTTRATLELSRAYRELSLAQGAWQSSIKELLAAHQSCWEYESVNKQIPLAVLVHRERAEADFRMALRDLRFSQGRCWVLERICEATATNGSKR